MRASSVRANARAIVTSDGEPYQHPHSSLDPWVRERSAASTSHRAYQDHSERPAHPLDRLVAQLNESWRVVDDPLQWILQRRKGNPRPKNSGWRDRSFCRTRDDCSVACASTAARSTSTPFPSLKRSLAGTPTGTAEMTAQT
jgi:hypothetical protein